MAAIKGDLVIISTNYHVCLFSRGLGIQIRSVNSCHKLSCNIYF